MTVTGGRTPYDPANALTGPARTLIAPISADLPVDAWDVVPPVGVAGVYAPVSPWFDLGLAAEAPNYAHSKEVEGLEYQQPAQDLFEQISNITRQFTTNIAEISPANLAILENTQATPETIAAASGKSAQTKVPFGLYDEFISYRVAMVSFRPSGAGMVTEPSGLIRPAAVVLILPTCRLSAEDSELSPERGTPTSANVTFTVFPDEELDPGEEHGFWVFETPGVIAA